LFAKEYSADILTLNIHVIRYDNDKNKYYYIDEQGKQTECGRNGKWPAQFVPNKTGYMGFAERQELSKKVRYLESFHPFTMFSTCKALNF